jgi:hypothetical protein
MRMLQCEEAKNKAEIELKSVEATFGELFLVNEQRRIQIEKLTKELDFAKWESKHHAELEKTNKSHEKTIQTLKKLMSLEIGLLSHIVDRQQKEVITSRIRMKQMAVMIRIPRVHHQFILKNGVYDFIESCERIVEENDYSRMRKEAQQAR